MDTLGETMDTVTEGAVSVDHYHELAAVYDFVITRRYDHDNMAAFVVDELSDDASAICVGGSGPGRLLALLANRYDEVVGVDLSPTMCELAASRTDAEIVEDDLLEYCERKRFDGYTLLGNSIAHLPIGNIQSFFETARTCLASGGVLAIDFTLTETLSNGLLRSDSFRSERYQVDRTVIVTLEDRKPDALGRPARYTYSYELTDEETGETVTTGTSVSVRAFDPPELLGAAIRAGFIEVSVVDPPTPHGGGLLAHRRE